MNSQDRYPIFASNGGLFLMQTRLGNAQRGHNLLKKKSDALQHRSRTILVKILETKEILNKLLQDASMSLSELKYFGGDAVKVILENVEQAHTRVCIEKENIVGIQVPIYVPVFAGRDCNGLAGLGRCGLRVAHSRKSYQAALRLSLELASMQTAFMTLNEVIKNINRRVNGIAHIILPRMKRTIVYVMGELDEQERENLYRLKLVQKRKEKQKALNKNKEAGKEKSLSPANSLTYLGSCSSSASSVIPGSTSSAASCSTSSSLCSSESISSALSCFEEDEDILF